MGDTFRVHRCDIPKKIGDEKADGIKTTKADIIITACPGCMINLTDIAAQQDVAEDIPFPGTGRVGDDLRAEDSVMALRRRKRGTQGW
jgi:Fe-S oxidoreductase